MRTNKLALAAAVAAVLTGAFAADDAALKKVHVPERLDNVRLIRPVAATKNHILVTNVGGAIPQRDWSDVVTYAVSRLQLNVWTNTAASFDPHPYVDEPDLGQKAFGEKSKVCVFLVDSPKLPRLVGAPGFWCAANVRGLLNDKPDRQTERDRYAKLILKGLAYACGGGATIERKCSLFYGSFTPAGMDKTSIMVSPMTYFPMLEILRAIGGDEILSPAVDE